jgi:hypothetical protein
MTDRRTDENYDFCTPNTFCEEGPIAGFRRFTILPTFSLVHEIKRKCNNNEYILIKICTKLFKYLIALQ